MKKKLFSINAIKKILRNEGARAVSEKAAIKLNKIAGDYTALLARKAIKNALYSGRKVVKEEDIELD